MRKENFCFAFVFLFRFRVYLMLSISRSDPIMAAQYACGFHLNFINKKSHCGG